MEGHMNTVATVDYHTAGEPFRILERPEVAILGETVAERRVFAIGDADVQALRRFLCFEPRGHADMYGGFIVPPDDDGALLGVLFWHKDGFSTACGHGTIALGAWAVHTGLVTPDPSGVTEVRIDVPSGRVTARVQTVGGEVVGVDFVNVPSYVLHRDVPISTSRGDVTVDVVYGGAIYAHLNAASVGLSVRPEHHADRHRAGGQASPQWHRVRRPSPRRPPQRHLRHHPVRRSRHRRGRQRAPAQRRYLRRW
jgi:proline racemase